MNQYTPFPRRFQAGNAVFGNCARDVRSHAPPGWRLSMRRSRGDRPTIGRSKLRPSRWPRQARPLRRVEDAPPYRLLLLVPCAVRQLYVSVLILDNLNARKLSGVFFACQHNRLVISDISPMNDAIKESGLCRCEVRCLQSGYHVT